MVGSRFSGREAGVMRGRGGRGLLMACVLAAAVATALPAQAATKDIVLERVTRPHTGGAAASDAMAVSILVENPDGTLVQRSTQALFRTGERLRVKVLASRDGDVSIHNTNAEGKTSEVWRGKIKFGQETVSPRMVLTGQGGREQLHVVLEPLTQPPGGIMGWLTSWWDSLAGKSKDIVLDAQSTEQTTYVLNPAGQGVASTVGIVHAQ